MLTKTLLCLMMICLTQINAFIHTPKPTERKLTYYGGVEVQGPIQGVNAVGFQYDSGAVWAVLCKNNGYGVVPGKMDGRGAAYFAWGGKEHHCQDYDIVGGTLYLKSMTLPKGCKPKGYQINDNKNYFNAVIDSEHGMIAGKANTEMSMAWYSWGGIEHYVRDKFYIIC